MKNLSFRARPAALALALFPAVPVLAQSPSSQSPAPAALKETVVAATRVAQPLSDLVADVTIVDRERIERSGTSSLAELLARLPGVEMGRAGNAGSTTSVFVRGAESRFTAVYVDGVRLDSQSTGGAAWEAIPLAMIERIEVLRGPAGAVYGSDALGGVIQIFTRKGEGAFAPYVGAGVGTYNTRKLEGGFSGSQGGFDYSLSLSDERSDGFNSRPLPTQNPDDDGWHTQSLALKLGVQLGKAHRVEATALNSRINAQYDNGLGKDDRNLHDLTTFGLAWNAQWTDAWSTRLSLTDSRDRYETKPSVYLSTTHLRGYLLQNEVRLGAHLFTAALERREDQLQNAPLDRTRTQDAVALGWGVTSGAHTVQLNLRHDDDSEFGGQNTGSAAYGYALTPQWRVTASAGTAFRAPTLYQRFSIYGQPSLQPEKGRNVELGLRYAQGADSFGVTAYRNRISNLINYVSGPGPCANGGAAIVFNGCYYNTARAQYEGVTFSGGTRVAGVTLGASLDVQNPQDLANKRLLARRARTHATLTADTTLGGWNLGAEAQLSGPRNDYVGATKYVLGGYGLFNLTASTRLARDWTFAARIDNLTDKHYELARQYATAGRSLFASVKWEPR